MPVAWKTGACSGGEGQAVVPRGEGAICGMQGVSTEEEREGSFGGGGPSAAEEEDLHEERDQLEGLSWGIAHEGRLEREDLVRLIRQEGTTLGACSWLEEHRVCRAEGWPWV
ncbi:hypothetical protein GOP47_0025105 [Adiantum capillus-veneris]|uniref:Uncharacterized protein n=1 Tax=Adiantum capillus-veneris TaxID=13818 RepID=A0A9D4Z497_ADICA|nr:hypothetical protein GOP47_0025105 [Adiantum capillus-veneris]